jgi:hypothetical protein
VKVSDSTVTRAVDDVKPMTRRHRRAPGVTLAKWYPRSCRLTGGRSTLFERSAAPLAAKVTPIEWPTREAPSASN